MEDNQIVTTRVLNFSRELVYQAWTEPEYLALWWGPNGFTNTFHHFDLSIGGHWKFTMHGPQGANYENEIVFLKIIENEELVFDHISPPHFKITVVLEELGEQTRVTFTMDFYTVKEYEAVKKVAVTANEENFDRLTAVLNQMI